MSYRLMARSGVKQRERMQFARPLAWGAGCAYRSAGAAARVTEAGLRPIVGTAL
jgi:hypothetical protein